MKNKILQWLILRGLVCFIHTSSNERYAGEAMQMWKPIIKPSKLIKVGSPIGLYSNGYWIRSSCAMMSEWLPYCNDNIRAFSLDPDYDGKMNVDPSEILKMVPNWKLIYEMMSKPFIRKVFITWIHLKQKIESTFSSLNHE